MRIDIDAAPNRKYRLGRREGLALLLLLCVLSTWAWMNRFIQDDAFISFQYARNLATGKGLVWAGGERIEGYTNFLWTLLLTIPFYSHLDPVWFTCVAGIGIFCVSLVLTYRIGILVSGSKVLGLLAMVLLGTNYTFSAYATGGLETQLQTCLLVASLFLLFRQMQTSTWSVRSAAVLSLTASAAILTRLDSAIVEGVILAVALVSVWRPCFPLRKRAHLIAALLLPLAVLVGGWLGWKLYYYGDLLPNTYYAKVSPVASFNAGIHYLTSFLTSYWLLPSVAFVIAALAKKNTGTDATIPLLVALTLLWCAYVIWVGGDFMEFRFLVLILPFVFLMITWAMRVFSTNVLVWSAVALLAIIGSIHHMTTFDQSSSRQQYRIETISELHGHLYDPDQNWVQIGRTLGQDFEQGSDLLIATTAVGAIPFYSELPTIDMLGLNDAWIARRGPIVGSKIGHQRRATLDYLLSRGANLVLGHPWLEPVGGVDRYSLSDPERLAIRFAMVVQDWALMPRDAAIVEIPIEGYKLSALYLVPNVAVDRAIAQNGWNVYSIGGGG